MIHKQMKFKKPLLNYLLFILLFSVSHLSIATDFILNDTSGTKHTLSQYKGKWVIVNYWATWCPPCLEEVPDLVALYDKNNKEVMVFGVVFDYENTAVVEKYVDDMLISYPIVLGNDMIRKQIGSSEVLPTTYIYNPQGQLVKAKRGIVTKKYLEAIISGELK